MIGLDRIKLLFLLFIVLLVACESPMMRGQSRNQFGGGGDDDIPVEERDTATPSKEEESDTTTGQQPSTTSTSAAKEPAVCQKKFKKNNICITIAWLQKPMVNAEAKAVLKFFSADGQVYPEVDEKSLKVFLWMKAHSHGSSPVELFEDKPGEVVVESMYFTMPGAWQIHAQMLDEMSKAVVDEVVWEIAL